jgi:hypothetical protein
MVFMAFSLMAQFEVVGSLLILGYWPIPQALGSSGAHIGVGRALVLVNTAVLVEAEEI